MYEITEAVQPFRVLGRADSWINGIDLITAIVVRQGGRAYLWHMPEIALLAIVTDRGMAGVQTEFVGG